MIRRFLEWLGVVKRAPKPTTAELLMQRVEEARADLYRATGIDSQTMALYDTAKDGDYRHKAYSVSVTVTKPDAETQQ